MSKEMAMIVDAKLADALQELRTLFSTGNANITPAMIERIREAAEFTKELSTVPALAIQTHVEFESSAFQIMDERLWNLHDALIPEVDGFGAKALRIGNTVAIIVEEGQSILSVYQTEGDAINRMGELRENYRNHVSAVEAYEMSQQDHETAADPLPPLIVGEPPLA